MTDAVPILQKRNRGRAGLGRPKGSLNKYTKAAKESFALCYEAIGGDTSFAEWAKEHRTEFYKLYARLIPLTINKVELASLPILQSPDDMIDEAIDSERVLDNGSGESEG